MRCWNSVSSRRVRGQERVQSGGVLGEPVAEQRDLGAADVVVVPRQVAEAGGELALQVSEADPERVEVEEPYRLDRLADSRGDVRLGGKELHGRG
jgi:hypothetical protein